MILVKNCDWKSGLATLFLLALVLLPFFGHADDGAEKIAVVGMDQNHRPVEQLVSKSDYMRNLGGIITSLHESTSQVLAVREPKSGWFLRNILVGFALSFEAGVGPILTLGGQSEFFLVYTNKTEATIP